MYIRNKQDKHRLEPVQFYTFFMSEVLCDSCQSVVLVDTIVNQAGNDIVYDSI